jgi:hypothetical protein
MKPSVALTLLVLGVWASRDLARADYFTLTPNGVLNIINAPGVPIDINDSGQIVGQYYNPPGGRQQGYLDTNGTITGIDFPGPTVTFPTSINNAGQVVGLLTNAFVGGFAGAFLYFNGAFTAINAPGGLPGQTVAYGINNLGQIVGTFGIPALPFMAS